MKHYIFLLLCCLVFFSGNAQVAQDDNEKIFTIVEEMPEFPGGTESLLYYISNQIRYPDVALKNGIEGRVYVSFMVNKEGEVNGPKVLRGIGGGCDEEAVRVVKSMPRWKPGRQNGNNVNVQFNLPVEFMIITEEKLKERAKKADYDPIQHGIELIDKGNYFKAMRDFDMAIAQNETSAVAYMKRGEAKIKMQDTTAACRDWGLATYYGDSTKLDQIRQDCNNVLVVDDDTFSTKSAAETKALMEDKKAEEILPQFPGGEDEMLQFIAKNVKYPFEAKNQKLSGRVYIRFYVTNKGKIRRPYILRGVGKSLDEESLRVIKSMPDWKPGTSKGKPVPVAYALPIHFTLK